jgi:hypothetical protein
VRLAILVVIAATRVALAYPQYQLTNDQTCTGCHISPAGGGLLNENGLAVAENLATYDVKPEAAHGGLVGPSWLVVGGDFRAGAGLVQDVGMRPAAFPMQAEMLAAAHASAFTAYATLGAQMGDGNRPLTFVLAREHWLMWQQKPGETSGLYVRAGRFMPVYGLRFAEHNDSTRRWGQTPLYGETYGAAVEYVTNAWEAHVTGFVHDPIQDPIETGDGAAAYAELRFTPHVSAGVEGRYAHSADDARTAGGMTAKWLAAPSVLLEAEAQAIHQTFAAGGTRDQIVSYLVASWFVHTGWFVDVGISQYDEDIAVKHLDTEALDVNVHWFATSHWELLLTNRLQTIAFTAGGPTSGYVLAQIHYRL